MNWFCNLFVTDTRVDWKMFNVAAEDEQLIDFVVSFGESFPKKDDKGNIITHPPQSPGKCPWSVL